LETSSPTCYQYHVKISNREREKSENIRILGEKTGKYPDFGEKPENIRILWKKPEIILILTREFLPAKKEYQAKIPNLKM
jgi:hypothetical protein